MTPSISVIIPIYNVEQYIEDCLQSVQSQSYHRMEIILVDDCGTDNSMVLAEEFIKEHGIQNSKIIRHTHNRGLSAARNTGLLSATGEYVYFLDSDDKLTAGAIQILAEPLQEYPYHFVIGNYEVIGSNHAYPELTLPEGNLMGNQDILAAYASSQWYMMAWNKLCSREFLLRNQLLFAEGLLHEDVIWSMKLACKATSMYVVQKKTYQYTIRNSSIMTGTSIEKDAFIYLSAFEEITSFIRQEHLQTNRSVYHILEGRKSTLLFSLLQKKQNNLFRQCYAVLYKMHHLSPYRAFKEKIIGIKYLVRDFHYLLPLSIGRIYKKSFYYIFYKLFGSPIEGGYW